MPACLLPSCIAMLAECLIGSPQAAHELLIREAPFGSWSRFQAALIACPARDLSMITTEPALRDRTSIPDRPSMIDQNFDVNRVGQRVLDADVNGVYELESITAAVRRGGTSGPTPCRIRSQPIRCDAADSWP